ncbi:ATP-binding protein [Nocardioides sp. Soil797]|nr:ATP-binding protein [Nocardioides sp. Soil797]
MEVKIGIQQAPRELVVEVDLDADGVEKAVAEALASDGLVSFTDTKGRRVLVPSQRIAFVEVGTGAAGQVGFRS